jgi:hypothetical protein
LRVNSDPFTGQYVIFAQGKLLDYQRIDWEGIRVQIHGDVWHNAFARPQLLFFWGEELFDSKQNLGTIGQLEWNKDGIRTKCLCPD